MSAIGERFLAHHLAFRPVDGTFMGRRDCDALLPRADAHAVAEELRAIEELEAAVAAAPESSVAERMDKRLADAELKLAAANLRERPRHANPAWYSGEATFGIVGLLLPQSEPLDADALRARFEALPDFLERQIRLLGNQSQKPCRFTVQRRPTATPHRTCRHFPMIAPTSNPFDGGRDANFV